MITKTWAPIFQPQLPETTLPGSLSITKDSKANALTIQDGERVANLKIMCGG